MSKTTVLAFIANLTGNQADQTALSRFYDDVVRDLAQQPIITQATIIEPITKGTAQYTYPTDSGKILGHLYDDDWAWHTKRHELESIDPGWRSHVGKPYAVVTESEDDRTFRLYPTPDVDSKALIPLHGAPFGLDYPPYAATIIHTEIPEDVPAWLEPAVAYETAAREYERESNHKNQQYADALRTMSELLLELVL